MDLVFLPENKLLGHFTSMAVSASVLILNNTVSCLHAGIVRDIPSQGVTVPYYYTSYFFIKEKDKQVQNKNNEVLKQRKGPIKF